MIFHLERILWSGPLLLGLMGCHIYFTVKLKLVQRFTFQGIRLSLTGQASEGVSPFGALSTSLAAAMGTGNIIGVATAVALGGPGTVFWCWMTGVLGIATRYAETYLTMKYRGENGAGGAMYILSRRLNKPLWGKAFALLGVAAALGTGAMIQSNALGSCMALWDIPLLPAGIMLTILTAISLVGGVKKIAAVCEKMVPAMSFVYILGCLAVLYVNRNHLLEALELILKDAFGLRSAAGGLLGGSLGSALRYGIARGLFTNESGMGTSPMAFAAGPCRSPETESLSAMTGVFWDTVVVCAMTGLALVSAEVANPSSFAATSPDRLCDLAFSLLPGGSLLLGISLCVFAFATILGWSWYGSCCAHYLSGSFGQRLYILGYCAAVFMGIFLDLEVLWSLGSILAGLMAVPNLYALFLLRREIQPPRSSPSEPQKPF